MSLHKEKENLFTLPTYLISEIKLWCFLSSPEKKEEHQIRESMISS